MIVYLNRIQKSPLKIKPKVNLLQAKLFSANISFKMLLRVKLEIEAVLNIKISIPYGASVSEVTLALSAS